MMAHVRAELLAAESVDFQLSQADATALAEHVAGCGRCAGFMAGTRQDADRLRRSARVHAPARVRTALATAAYGHRSRSTGRPALLLVAAVLIGLLLGAAVIVGALVRLPREPAIDWTAVPVTPLESDGDAAARMRRDPGRRTTQAAAWWYEEIR